MAARHCLGDRREALRLESTSELWAALDVDHTAVLHNIAMRGALLEVPSPLDLSRLRAATLRLSDGGPVLTGIVRHVRPSAGGDDERRYLVGLEFVGLSRAERVHLQQFIRDFRQPAIEV